MSRTWLGIDIGGTSTRLLTLSGENQWAGFRKLPTASWAQSGDALRALAGLINEMQAQQQIDGVMLGLPGILSRDRRHKDVNHLMLWDLMQLDTLPDNAVGLYLGTGMGNSLWLNGQFYHGEHGGAGEIGHIPLIDNDLPCPCGNYGCVETLTSGHWLSQWARQHCARTDLGQLFTLHGDRPELQQFVSRLAKIIAGEMNILDPQYLILGGGVLAMNDFPLESLRRQIVRHLRPPVTRDGLKMVFSHATDQTGCRGACLAAARQFGRKE